MIHQRSSPLESGPTRGLGGLDQPTHPKVVKQAPQRLDGDAHRQCASPDRYPQPPRQPMCREMTTTRPNGDDEPVTTSARYGIVVAVAAIPTQSRCSLRTKRAQLQLLFPLLFHNPGQPDRVFHRPESALVHSRSNPRTARFFATSWGKASTAHPRLPVMRTARPYHHPYIDGNPDCSHLHFTLQDYVKYPDALPYLTFTKFGIY